MAKTIFEEMGGTYVRQGDYDLPCLSLLTEKGNKPIGVWGQRHLRYLKQHRKVLYTNLLTSGKLNSYLADIDEQAEDLFFRLVKQVSEREGVSEQLKTVYPMTAVFNISGYYNANMFQVLIGVVILMVCVILSLLILKGWNRKTK